MNRIFLKLRQRLLRDNTGLNDAILANWTAFRPATEVGWRILSKAHEHWLHTESDSLSVHFNLLTGEFLVSGHPLSRMPSRYIEHPTYMPLFQESVLEVVPTGRPGMEFSIKSTYHDYEVHFGMEGMDMYVVAIRDSVT